MSQQFQGEQWVRQGNTEFYGSSNTVMNLNLFVDFVWVLITVVAADNDN